jgi:predicted dehydrogenase
VTKVDRPLNVAVIGLGVGEQHARRFHANPACRLRWVCDLDAQRSASLATELGSEAAPDFDAIVNDDTVDIVSIASYDDAHFDQVRRALERGKHVFVEKPLCQTLDQAVMLKAAWKAHGGRVKLQSNLVLRAAPMYQWLKREVREGKLGEVYSFAGEYLYGRIHKITEGWRKDVKNYSVMQGGGVHLIDLMLWITGRRPLTVTAVGNQIATRGSGFANLDCVTALMEMEGGAISTISANFGCVHRHQHVVRIFGTAATFFYDDAGARLHTSRAPDVAPVTVTQDPLPATKGDLIDDFVTAILNNSPMDTDMVFDSISISVACDRSVATKQQQRIEYI